MIRVSETSDIEHLRDEWDELFSRAQDASIFQTWEWVSCCQQFFGNGDQSLILTVRRRNKLIGLAPLKIVRMYNLPLRRVQFIGTGLSDYLNFLLDDTAENVALEAIFEWLNENQERWDVLDLQQIPEDTATWRFLIQGNSGVYSQSQWSAQEVCPYVPLAESWEETLRGFSKKLRSNLGYYDRLMNRHFRVSKGLLAGCELEEGMDALFRLHALRWRERWLPGVLFGRRKQNFHRQVMRMTAARGWLRLHGIRLNGQLQCVLYCFACKGKYYYYIGGFEPALSKYSLGTVLIGCAIRDAIECGCHEFDFLRGDEPYKARWTSTRRTNFRLMAHQNTVRSRTTASIHSMEQSIEQKVKRKLRKGYAGQ